MRELGIVTLEGILYSFGSALGTAIIRECLGVNPTSAAWLKVGSTLPCLPWFLQQCACRLNKKITGSEQLKMRYTSLCVTSGIMIAGLIQSRNTGIGTMVLNNKLVSLGIAAAVCATSFAFGWLCEE